MSDDEKQSEDTTEEPRGLLRYRRDRRIQQEAVDAQAEGMAEMEAAKVDEPQIEQATDEEVLLDGEGDEEFLQHALQFRDRPDRFRGDYKFVTRLAARRARRRKQITAVEHEQVLSLIRKPIRLHKETKRPFDAWQEFENQIRAQMPKEMAAKDGLDWSDLWKQMVEWFKENWMTVLKVALSILLMVI